MQVSLAQSGSDILPCWQRSAVSGYEVGNALMPKDLQQADRRTIARRGPSSETICTGRQPAIENISRYDEDTAVFSRRGLHELTSTKLPIVV